MPSASIPSCADYAQSQARKDRGRLGSGLLKVKQQAEELSLFLKSFRELQKSIFHAAAVLVSFHVCASYT